MTVRLSQSECQDCSGCVTSRSMWVQLSFYSFVADLDNLNAHALTLATTDLTALLHARADRLK